MLCVFISYLMMLPEGRFRPVRWLLAGLVMGMAFWLKYNAVVFFPLILVLPFVHFSGLDQEPRWARLAVPFRRLVRQTGVAVAGFSLAIAAMLVHLWMVGVWPWFKEEQLEVLPRYAALVFER